MTTRDPRTLSRRTTLRWIAASPLASALPHWSRLNAAAPIARGSAGLGYGTDPDLRHPTVPWPLLMSSRELQATAALADLILPPTESAPAPSAIGVQHFINEWVSAPYPDQLQDRRLIFEGLERLNHENFLEVDDRTRAVVLAALAAEQSSPSFERLRFLVVGAYYTTPEGWKDIGYIGNVPLASYPPITAEERARLDSELAKLGLQT
jgi:hypothetical protein